MYNILKYVCAKACLTLAVGFAKISVPAFLMVDK